MGMHNIKFLLHQTTTNVGYIEYIYVRSEREREMECFPEWLDFGDLSGALKMHAFQKQVVGQMEGGTSMENVLILPRQLHAEHAEHFVTDIGHGLDVGMRLCFEYGPTDASLVVDACKGAQVAGRIAVVGS